MRFEFVDEGTKLEAAAGSELTCPPAQALPRRSILAPRKSQRDEVAAPLVRETEQPAIEDFPQQTQYGGSGPFPGKRFVTRTPLFVRVRAQSE